MMFNRSIPFAILLFCSICCRAQDDRYVYRDTALMRQDSVIASGDGEEAEEAAAAWVRDTLLKRNELGIEPDSIRALKNMKSLSYAKKLDSLLYAYQQKAEQEEAGATDQPPFWARILLSPITRYFFWGLAIFFVCLILYKLFFSEGFFQHSYSKVKLPKQGDQEEDAAVNADYGKLISQAVGARNYRLALRYHYLQSLQRLAAKAVIQFSPDKTNYQYVRELSGKSYRDQFAALTLNYEYVWYGEFVIGEEVFYDIQNRFRKFNSQL
jgi:hypothetical protein